MKKLIYKLTYLTALFTLIYSCDDVERVYYNDAAETVLSLSDNDLVLNEEGFVIGYIVKVFDDRSLISTIINSEFSIPGIDKYGNQYLITSNREELLINSIYIEEVNLNIDYISKSAVEKLKKIGGTVNLKKKI